MSGVKHRWRWALVFVVVLLAVISAVTSFMSGDFHWEWTDEHRA
ncbi:MAG: hypothetical protein ACRDRY_13010 [Pseudonocardiaceae bacterium]